MFADPRKILESFGIAPGLIVADVGAGSGHYALEAAKLVSREGANGKVYAIDVQKGLLDKLKNEAIREHVANVEVVWGNAEKASGTKLRNGIADVVIVVNVLFQIEDKPAFLRELKRILKPRARLLLIEWSDGFGGIGPDAARVVKPDAAVDLFSKAGFAFDKDIHVGSHHYGKIFRL